MFINCTYKKFCLVILPVIITAPSRYFECCIHPCLLVWCSSWVSVQLPYPRNWCRFACAYGAYSDKGVLIHLLVNNWNSCTIFCYLGHISHKSKIGVSSGFACKTSPQLPQPIVVQVPQRELYCSAAGSENSAWEPKT